LSYLQCRRIEDVGGHLLGAQAQWERSFRRSPFATRSRRRLSIWTSVVETEIDLVPYKPKKMAIAAALSNSFGFGGTNASLILTAPE